MMDVRLKEHFKPKLPKDGIRVSVMITERKLQMTFLKYKLRLIILQSAASKNSVFKPI